MVSNAWPEAMVVSPVDAPKKIPLLLVQSTNTLPLKVALLVKAIWKLVEPPATKRVVPLKVVGVLVPILIS